MYAHVRQRGYIAILMLLIGCALVAILYTARSGKSDSGDPNPQSLSPIEKDIRAFESAKQLHSVTDVHNSEINDLLK